MVCVKWHLYDISEYLFGFFVCSNSLSSQTIKSKHTTVYLPLTVRLGSIQGERSLLLSFNFLCTQCQPNKLPLGRCTSKQPSARIQECDCIDQTWEDGLFLDIQYSTCTAKPFATAQVSLDVLRSRLLFQFFLFTMLRLLYCLDRVSGYYCNKMKCPKEGRMQDALNASTFTAIWMKVQGSSCGHMHSSLTFNKDVACLLPEMCGNCSLQLFMCTPFQQ